MTVDILMATYNGEKYIKNQLLSLQQQTFSDWNLLIRDDGSTDNTLDIIQEFKKHDSRIKIIETDGVKGRGPGRNFLELTKCSLSKYVIFCDQDDIWFEKKLELLVGTGLTHQCLYFEQPHTFEQILFIQTAEPALVGHA